MGLKYFMYHFYKKKAIRDEDYLRFGLIFPKKTNLKLFCIFEKALVLEERSLSYYQVYVEYSVFWQSVGLSLTSTELMVA